MKTATNNDLAGIYEILDNMNQVIVEIKNELNHHIRKNNTDATSKHVSENTQADSLRGRRVTCGYCYSESIVYHFKWTSMKCQNPNCNQIVDKGDWLIS